MVNNSKYYHYILYNREKVDTLSLYLKSHTCCKHIMSRSTFNKLCNQSKAHFKGYILVKLEKPILDESWIPKKHKPHIFKITV